MELFLPLAHTTMINSTFVYGQHEIVEVCKASRRTKCRYGSKCYNFPCKYIHKREEYFEIESIKEFRRYFSLNSFEELCQYNIGGKKEVDDLINELKPFKNCVDAELMGAFLKLMEEKGLLRKTALHIDCAFTNDEEKTTTTLKMMSYVFARIYMAYYRDVVGYGHITFLDIGSFIKKTLSKDLPDVSLANTMFFCSRGFVDSDLEASRTAVFALGKLNERLEEASDHEKAAEITKIHTKLKEEIFETKAFQKGLENFLISINRSKGDLIRALDILKNLKIQLVKEAPFYGMCGLNRTIYINPESIWLGMTSKDDQAELARTTTIIIHECGHELLRELEGKFEAVTPRKAGKSNTETLEGGYRLEKALFGELYQCQYWIASEAINDPKRWTDVPFKFTEVEEKFIRAGGARRVNCTQSGLELKTIPCFE